jgi:hypothetical protein
MNYRVQNKMRLSVVEAGETLGRPNIAGLPGRSGAEFRAIPPERVGIHGEYDHNGLAKRVIKAFGEQLEAAVADQLEVRQRGRVVILMGRIACPQLFASLTAIALSVEGAAFVEAYDIEVRHPKAA